MNMNIAGDKDLFNFLANAPKEFREGEKIKKYQLKNGDYIHCVLWNMHFYITGTDIVKILVWRFNNAGRQITSPKKFEEGVFSDLRNLKPGIDATLERPRSEFLEFLYKNGCIRTQKKQKVFFWYSVPHDALFCDALDRDLRRETSYYSYSKYMNTFAPVGMMEQIEFNHHDNAPYTPPPGAALKKKNSVKMAARNKRSPKDSLIRPEYKMQKPNHDLLNTCMPLDMPDSMCDYTGYNNTGLDPFIPFGAQGSYNFNYSDIGFADEMNINNIEFGQFSSPPTKIETEKTYGMPEIFNTQKDDQTDDTAGYMNSNRNYVQNIPNTQVTKSKRSTTAQTSSMGINNDDQNNVDHNPHPFLRVYNPNRARPSDEPVVVCLQHFIEGISDLLIEIQRYEREAEGYFNTNQRDDKFLQEYLRNIESVKNNTGSDPESIKNKQTRLTCLSEQVQCLEEKIKVSEAGYKESQSLIKSKIEEMSLDIKEGQERFPEEYQDGFKSFEENPHYMAALQYTPVLNED